MEGDQGVGARCGTRRRDRAVWRPLLTFVSKFWTAEGPG